MNIHIKVYGIACTSILAWVMITSPPFGSAVDFPITDINWGAASNGCRLGIRIETNYVGALPPSAVVYIENVNKTQVFIRVPRERHIRILASPEAETVTTSEIVLASSGKRVRYKLLSPNLPTQLETVKLSEVFAEATRSNFLIRTSTRIAVDPSMKNLVGRTADYYWLPPVTNVITFSSRSERGPTIDKQGR